MSLYAGLAPQDALAKWYAIRQKPQNALTPEEKNDLAGGMTDLAAQNPQAWQLVKTGVDDPSNQKNRKIFNPSTGEWDDQEKKGLFSHPETWLQLGFGAGLGGLAAAPLLAGAATDSAAFTAAGGESALTGGVAPAVAPVVTGGGGGASSLLKQILGGGAGSTTNAGISALTTLLGTHMANSAASDAAKAQSDALKYSTDVQDAAAKRNELFLRQQAENSYANTEATRRANYDQWRAREARVSNLGAALGLSQRDIPNYVAGVDPRFLDPSTPLPPTTADTTPPNIPGRAAGGPVNAGNPYVVGENGPEVVVPNQNATVLPRATLPTAGSAPPVAGGDLMSALQSNYQSLGATPTGPGSGPTDIGYFAKRITETGGMTPQNIAYWFGPSGRIAKELAGAVPPEPSGGSASGAAATPYLPGSLGSAMTRRTNFWWS